MPRSIPLSKKAIKRQVHEAIFLAVRADRRLLGIPEAARDQIVIYAVNEAMGYDRLVRDPTEMLDVPENRVVVDTAIEVAITAGQAAYQSCLNSH